MTRKIEIGLFREIDESILVDETIKKFGYDPRYLKPSSEKLVIKQFICCGIIEERKFRAALKQHKCKKCANKERSVLSAEKRSITMKKWFIKNTHPRKGKHHSEESKEKIRQSHLSIIAPTEWNGKKRSPETCLKISKSNIGKPCPQAALDYWKNPEHLGVNHHRYGKKPSHSYKIWYICKDGERICFRSVWEARVARYFDENNIEWEYEKHTFPIKYIWEHKIKNSTYLPDFWLKTDAQFVEVKGLWREEYVLKYQAFKEQYASLKIEIWDRKILNCKKIKTGKIQAGEFNNEDIQGSNN